MSEKKDTKEEKLVDDYGVEWKPAEKRSHGPLIVMAVLLLLVVPCMLWEYFMPAGP